MLILILEKSDEKGAPTVRARDRLDAPVYCRYNRLPSPNEATYSGRDRDQDQACIDDKGKLSKN